MKQNVIVTIACIESLLSPRAINGLLFYHLSDVTKNGELLETVDVGEVIWSLAPVTSTALSKICHDLSFY